MGRVVARVATGLLRVGHSTSMLESRLSRGLARLFVTGVATTTTIACGATTIREAGPAATTVEYVATQEILTPLPLRVRLPASENAEHVVVLFRLWGSRGWKSLELARRGQTWSGEISCREVSTVTGDTTYFFVVLDDDGQLVGGSGSPDWPHVATIVGKLPEGPQSLPGSAAVLRCHDPADCPPDFPGCPAYAVSRRSCRSDQDCAGASGRCAWDGYCGSPSGEMSSAGEPEIDDLELAIASVRNRFRKSARAVGAVSGAVGGSSDKTKNGASREERPAF